MEGNKENNKLQEEHYTVVEIDRKLTNIEKAIASFESIAVEGLNKWSESKKQQVELEKAKEKLFDQQHKRVTSLAKISIGAVVILIIATLIAKEPKLVELILTSSFAIGAGAGITSLLNKKNTQ